MKKLSLLMFAILILACGTETTVVEEPEPVIEEPHPVAMEEEPSPAPQIVAGSVFDGRVDVTTIFPLFCHPFPCSRIEGKRDVDPELLNRDGIILEFSDHLNMYVVDLQLGHGVPLNWSPRDIVDHWDIGKRVHLLPAKDSRLLEYSQMYVIEIYAQASCNDAKTTIRFRTMPKP